MKYLRIIFLFLLSAMANLAWAQPELPSEQVEVIKIFEAQLAESNKVAVQPELPTLDTTVAKQTYDVQPKTIDVEYPAPRLKPITYKSDEEIADAYKAYLKFGGGLPKSIYGDGSFNTLIKTGEKKAVDIGINLFHHQADFSDKKVENQRFGLTKAQGKATYYSDKGFGVGGNIGYTNNRTSYYGYSVQPFKVYPTLPKEDVQQVYGIFDLGGKFFNSVQTAGDINYSAGFDLYAMGDDIAAANEFGFDLKLKATKWIRGKHSFDIGLRTDFTSFKVSGETQSLNNYSLTPAFTYHGNAVKVKAGVNLMSSNDEYFPFPDLEVVLNLTGNELAFYTGVNGDLQKNTFRSLTTYNPYIYTGLPAGSIVNTKYYHVYAGVKGNFKSFEYMLQGGFKPTNDLALFYYRHQQDKLSDFDVRYDDVNIINLRASLKANVLKSLSMTATLSYNIFDMSNGEEPKPWHLPALDANFMAVYTTADNKLRAKAQVNVQDGAYYNALGGVQRWGKLNNLFDVSVGGEYWILKKFGAFLEVNNLFNNKRQRWVYYPTYGVNVLAGINARF
ncbi:MAG: hypothetical protein IT258_02245 [Saprospiraceae bacterium]|nr:hypothetical protein [Saprospiraceae bacterium]